MNGQHSLLLAFMTVVVLEDAIKVIQIEHQESIYVNYTCYEIYKQPLF